jgi:hypothetical protein
MVLFCLVGLQMGIAFGFGFIYFTERFDASGALLGLTLTVPPSLWVPDFQDFTLARCRSRMTSIGHRSHLRLHPRPQVQAILEVPLFQVCAV